MDRGLLISFEGLDGAGKTTQILQLVQWLQNSNLEYVQTREPGGTPLGVEIRRLLFHEPDLMITPLAEAFLFQADRAQHVATLIQPALAAGKLVVTDRYFDSSIAYQGIARGVGAPLVEQLSLVATWGLVPDLTFYLDLDPALVSTRTAVKQEQGNLRTRQSRFDSESEQFHRQLRAAFLSIAQSYSDRIMIIDAAQPPETIHQFIVARVTQLLSSHGVNIP